MIVIIDFGSQTTHLIERRLLELGVDAMTLEPTVALAKIKSLQPAGIILSGGPASVYEQGSPSIDLSFLTQGIPILGICYGWQLMAQVLKGKVEPSKKEYGPAKLLLKQTSTLLTGLPETSTIWQSHGDSVVTLPKGFAVLASTEDLENSAVGNEEQQLFGVQFHPEMSHTEFGSLILQNFATRICKLPLKPKKLDIKKIISEIKEKVGDALVIGAVSGGTDSSVAGALVAAAIGKQFIPVYVESGLMREGTLARVQNTFPKLFGVPLTVVQAENEFLSKLKGVTDPEEKRKVIGELYVRLFEKEMKQHPQVKFLMQGTTYADFIHSQGNKRSAHIKSHHNVGGLPKDMKLELLEPLRYYYTDQVRMLGAAVGLPKDVVYQQPFPGPGHAVRILGEVTPEKLQKQRLADAIVVEELKTTGWYDKVFQCWSILTNSQSTAVKGDHRFFGDVFAVRVVTSVDRMTANWVELPYEVLQRISTRIVNEVPEVSRVVYDITTKPPATMEWE